MPPKQHLGKSFANYRKSKMNRAGEETLPYLQEASLVAGKEATCNAGDPGSIPGLGRSAGEGIGHPLQYSWASLGGSEGKESTCNVVDLGSIPVLRRSPGEGHGNPLQYSCPENPKDRGAWQVTVHRTVKSWTQLKRLSTHAHTEEQRAEQ